MSTTSAESVGGGAARVQTIFEERSLTKPKRNKRVVTSKRRSKTHLMIPAGARIVDMCVWNEGWMSETEGTSNIG